MIDTSLYHRLSSVRRRLQMRRALLMLTTIWTLAAMAAIALWWLKLNQGLQLPMGLAVLLAITLVATLAGLWFAMRDEGDFSRTARQVESNFPELDSALVTAIEQQPTQINRPLGYLQSEVVRRAVYHGYQHRWQRIVPQWQLLLAAVISGLSFVVLFASIAGQYFSPMANWASSLVGSGGDAMAVADDRTTLSVEPGDVEIERGTSLLVLARFPSISAPGRVELQFSDQSGNSTIVEMPRSLDDPMFGVRLPAINEPIEYLVRYDGNETSTFKVDVFDYPALERADALVTPPESSKAEPQVLKDFRRVTAMQNSQLQIEFFLNKPVTLARLVGRDGQQVVVSGDKLNPRRMTCDMNLVQNAQYELELIDDRDRSNRDKPVFSINVVENQCPVFEQQSPHGDMEASALEEIQIAAKIQDDSGLERTGISYSQADNTMLDVPLSGAAAAGETQIVEFLLDLEKMNVVADDLLTFYFWAEDIGPDGVLRRTESDLNFVEVRPFEEVFRQGEPPAGGENGGQGQGQGGDQAGGQQAVEVLQLQKQVMIATWNMLRREGDASEPAFADDVKTIAESQQVVLDQLQTLLKVEQDELIQSLGNDAALPMTVALGELEKSIMEQSIDPLRKAFSAEQAAYAKLLKLRDRENEVAMSQQQSGGGGGQNSRSQRQLQNLQLKNEENRYQNEQQARAETETEQQRENRQVLNRLRELARRQNDLNEQLRELQSALEKAETEEEKKELADRLKRLQEEQEKVLRDAEELQQRMENPDNQQRMSEEARQLQQAREDIQQANESLEQSDVPNANAEGTRAQRQLRDLRDEFQNRASGQFDDRIQELRNEVRDIDSVQEEISKQLNDDRNNESQRSLSEDTSRDELPQRMKQQGQRVRNLQRDMQELVVESEEIEPIMADRLYDSWRQSQQSPPADALDWSSQSLQRGLVDEARELNDDAVEGIQQLREGVDQAAEAVLGEEAEALRRANAELQRLSSELETEARRAGGTEPESTETDAGSANPNGDEQNPAQSQNSSEESGQPTGDRNQPDTGRPSGEPPSLNERNQQDSRGRYGANPQLNYDNNEDWLQPLSGDDYTDWIDRLRDVEEMVADPDLRAEATRIREEARTIRGEARRHSQPPNWNLVEMKVLRPLFELQDRVHEELLRQSEQQSLVPIDRDPVPPEFEDAVRQYYEQLGRGQR